MGAEILPESSHPTRYVFLLGCAPAVEAIRVSPTPTKMSDALVNTRFTRGP